MLDWQLQKLSEAEEALSKSGVSKLLFFTDKVARPASKVSRGPLSRSLHIKMNVSLDKQSLLAKKSLHRKHASNLQDLCFKNRTLTEKDLQNSSDSLASKPPGHGRPFSGRQSVANASISIGHRQY